MPKKASDFILRQISRDETYTQDDYNQLMEHEGEFTYSDFKSWNMARLWRTARVLRDEAFRRANEFERAVSQEGLPLSQAYARLEEREITWVQDKQRAKFGSTKIELINNIIQTMTFLDDKTSTVEGWREVLNQMSEKTNLPIEMLSNKSESASFFDIYYKVTAYLDERGIIWSPSETMRAVYNALEEAGYNNDWNDPKFVELIQKRVEEKTRGYYEEQQKAYQALDAEQFFTRKK